MAKEYVFTFSKPIPLTSKVIEIMNKIVRSLGGTRFYAEGNALVVVI